MEEKTFKLPAPRPAGPLSLEEALASRRSVRSYRDEPLQLSLVGQMLWAAQGITLDTRGYRTAPSAGATFPLEVYLVAGKIDGLEPGLYRYVPSGHVGQNISLQVVAYGLGTVMVGAFSDENVKSLLRLPANEDPLYIIPVGKPE